MQRSSECVSKATQGLTKHTAKGTVEVKATTYMHKYVEHLTIWCVTAPNKG